MVQRHGRWIRIYAHRLPFLKERSLEEYMGLLGSEMNGGVDTQQQNYETVQGWGYSEIY